MKKYVSTVVFLLTFLFVPSILYAHPGRTDASDCHVCRTDCDEWGEAWEARHCHGGDFSSAETQPVATPLPIKQLTSEPINTATKAPTSTQTATPAITDESTLEVKGESIEIQQDIEEEVSNTEEATKAESPLVNGLATLGLVLGAGYLGIRKLRARGSQ